ncbi:MAG: thioredoxin domain-containing protein, partial [Chloroflexi bacterium]|nr:thioredoxin domain-containing protein [Chloroflexota bacterium]
MNRLAHETSPYLLQHAHNPVDWYPWGEEALARAQAEDRPILLSIGYSACHWCHVMERESFTNEEIAALMNAEFVCIKVDREERPDLDAIYMMAVQLLTRRGGWPMTVFLTPQGVPFYGGTYFPPEDRQGLPGFPKVLRNVAEAYRNRREQVLQGTDRLMAALEGQLAAPPGPRYALDVGIPDAAIQGLQRRFDAANGGFGPMPKFPQPMTLDFLLRAWRRSGDPAPRKMLEVTLTKMAHGGIYDHLGGGFHRYAVDGRWLVPHFEKMLYDNALLSLLYLHAYQAFGQPEYRRVAEETLDYVQRDMTSPEGAFYASEDADSEGEEGKFYIWRAEEIEAALGPADARLLGRYYGVFEGPNFEGQNILYMPRDPDVTTALAMATPEQMAEAVARGRAALQALRNQRVRPARDDKALAAWNGLMLRSFAQAAGALGRADYRETAL